MNLSTKTKQLWLWPLLISVLLIIALELAVRQGWLPGYLFPAPSDIARILLQGDSDIWQSAQSTLWHSLLGLLASFGIGFVICLLATLADPLRYFLLPVSVFFQTVPIIAIAPLFVIYLGFGSPTVVASAFFVSLFPILANGLLGLQRVPESLLDLFRIQKANRLQVLFFLRIPYSYSSFYAGLKVAIGLSIIGCIAGEFVAGGGLGALIDSARTQQRIDLVYASLVIMSGIALLMLSVLAVLDRGVRAVRPLP